MTSNNLQEIFNALKKSDFLKFRDLHSSLPGYKTCITRNDLISLFHNEMNKKQASVLKIYLTSKPKDYVSLIKRISQQFLNGYQPQVHEDHDLMNPIRELYIFSLLFGRSELAMYLVDLLPHQLAAALFGTYVCQQILEYQKDNWLLKDAHDRARALKDDLEKKAIEYLIQCYKKNYEKTKNLLTCELIEYASESCFMYAIKANDIEFVNSSPFLEIYSMKFRGNLSATWIEVTLASIFPFLVSLDYGKIKSDLVDQLSYQPCCPAITAIQMFYRNPRVKFAVSTWFYALFIIAYSLNLVFNFSLVPNHWEMFIVFWAITFIMEEVRQVFNEIYYDKANLATALIKNKFEILAGILYLGGFLLRFINLRMEDIDLFNSNALLLQISLGMSLIAFVFYCVEMTRCLITNATVGPTLVMISRVLTNQFLSLFVVLLLAGVVYGVMIEAWIYNGFKRDIWSFTWGLATRPMFQIFGEFALEDLGLTCDQEEGNLPLAYSRCGANSETIKMITSMLHTAFLVITNVIILNLFITMFTNNYENPHVYWVHRNMSVCIEYFNRPSFPPPFNWISYIYNCLSCRACSQRIRNMINENLSEEDKSVVLTFIHSVINDEYEEEQTDSESHV